MMRSPFVKIIGIIFAVAGLYFIYQNINGFVETCNQKDWETATATMVNIRQRYESHGIHSRGSKLVYDVFYEYTADGKIYSGTIYGTADYSKKTGASFEVKYNPLSPGESTHILSPSVTNLIFGIAVSVVYILLSLIITGVIKFKHIRCVFNKHKAKKSEP